jgi:hypothetical protein
MFLIIWEPPVVARQNYEKTFHKHFRKIFTWDDDLVDSKKYIKLFIPQPPYRSKVPEVPFGDKKLLTSISADKTSDHPKELYSERLAAIKYFSKKFPKNFTFYGMGWERRLSALDRIKEHFLPTFYRCYGGTVEDKVQTFAGFKFSICYENIKNVNGYVTEKIFDSFKAGCVPVYRGAENIKNYIPANCFIDLREFANYDELARFLVGMSEEDHLKYQDNIKNFLKSDKYTPFTSDNFARTLINGVLGQ